MYMYDVNEHMVPSPNSVDFFPQHWEGPQSSHHSAEGHF